MDKNKKIIISFIVAVFFFTVGTTYYAYLTHADPSIPGQSTSENGKDEEINYNESKDEEEKDEKDEEDEEKTKTGHGLDFDYPDAVRGIYLTGHSAGGERLNRLLDLVDSTELNAMVIDVKDDTGNITFKLEDTPYDEYSKNYISDPEELLKTLEEHEIYPIARIVVFKDSVLAPKNPELSFRNPDGNIWRNNRNEAYVNPFIKDIWEYNIEIAKIAAKLGFQDIQFDYVRFPEGFENRDDELQYSFGDYSEDALMPRIIDEWEEEIEDSREKMKQAKEEIEKIERTNDHNDDNNENGDNENNSDNGDNFNNDENDKDSNEKDDEPEPPEYSYGLARTQAITDFVSYAYEELEPYDVDVSVDIFGYTAVDMDAHGIGQNFLDISSNVDVISSMIYPSHWGPGYFGIPRPDTEPYKLTTEYVTRENKILSQLEDPPISRPWIQDFTATWLGSGNYISYGKEEVEAQIKALNENDVYEFLIWDSNNRYTDGVNYKPLSGN